MRKNGRNRGQKVETTALEKERICLSRKRGTRNTEGRLKVPPPGITERNWKYGIRKGITRNMEGRLKVPPLGIMERVNLPMKSPSLEEDQTYWSP